MTTRRIPALTLMLLAAGALPAEGAGRGAAAEGRALAERHCMRCHGIGPRDESPMAEAPPFRRLHERYPIDSLAEAFAEGIVVGHAEMPAFEFTPAEIDALLTYLKSLNRRTRG